MKKSVNEQLLRELLLFLVGSPDTGLFSSCLALFGLRDAFKIKKVYILGLCPKVIDPLPSRGQKKLGLFGLHLDPLPPL